MDPMMVWKSVVCAVALVVAGTLSALGKLDAHAVLDFSKWVLGFWVGAASISAAVQKLSGRPVAATLEQLAAPLEQAAPTPRSPKLPPPLPVLALVALALALGACTPSERSTAAVVASAAVPVCDGVLLTEAPELEPLCATIPEIEAAIAELLAERKVLPITADGQHVGTAYYRPTPAEIHRRVFARRQGGHR